MEAGSWLGAGVIIMNDKERLYFDALNEIAEHVGDSFENPISLSLLCLRLGISIKEKKHTQGGTFQSYILFRKH